MACRRSKPRRTCGRKKDGRSQRGLGPARHRAEKGLPEGTESKGQGDLTNQLYSYLLYGKARVLKFYVPVSTSVLNELYL